jgi:rSAM/selenodomain-associated transferase 2
MTPADITVVIPTLNEAQSIANSVHSAIAAGATEIIVSDGGSSDRTLEIASEAGASKIVRSLAGRGVQMNSGAHLAKKHFILFLHADNQLSGQALEQICVHENAVWGAFRQRIDSPKKIYRFIEWGNTCRVQWRGMAFGDQGFFVRRALFKELGGFAEMPLMEDVEMSQRLRRIEKPAVLNGPLIVNARRWEKQGLLRQTLMNWQIQFAYFRGVPADQLARKYYGN